MHPTTTTESRPEAMADVPGICEIPLTRAVVQYRDAHELNRSGGRIQDIGLAVVVEGRFASSVRAIDLGSAEAKYLNLASELVILDWVYDPTLAHIRALAAAGREVAATAAGRESAVAAAPGPSGELRRYCFDLALRILDRRGFSPLTRPTLLRIGFRDLCKDLDLHESTVVRIVSGRGEVTRVHLDYDANALVFRSAGPSLGETMKAGIREVFPGLPIQRPADDDEGGSTAWLVRFGVPVTFGELRASLLAMRRGIHRLLVRFEPERFRSVEGMLETFGERATLDLLARQGAEADWRDARVGSRSGRQGVPAAGPVAGLERTVPMSVH